MRERNYKFDNVKCLLIFLVVFGHLIQNHDNTYVQLLHRMILVFHMPVFLFITGYFSRFERRRIAWTLLFSYLVFQTLYLSFEAMIRGTEPTRYQYTTPFWLLWYLLVDMMYQLLIPLLDVRRKSLQLTVVAGSILLSLLAGMDTTIGYPLSLSRFFSFLPFFVMGFYAGRHRETFEQRLKLPLWLAAILLVALAVVTAAMLRWLRITPNMLYGSFSYEDAGYTPAIKLVMLVAAMCWCILLLAGMPNRKLPVISVIGKNTFPVYLMHGFVVLLVAHRLHILPAGTIQYVAAAGLLALGIMVLFGNPWFAKAFGFVFSGRWVAKLKNLVGRIWKKARKTANSAS